MVQTWERNKDTHPGQLMAPKAHRPKEQAAAKQNKRAKPHKLSGLALGQHSPSGHERTTLNSETLLWITSADNEVDLKLAVPYLLGMSKSMLPKEISIQFQDIFIPTLLAYCGTTSNPWNLPCPLKEIIAELWLTSVPMTGIADLQAQQKKSLQHGSTQMSFWTMRAVEHGLNGQLMCNLHGIGAFHALLILQTLACHYTKTINAVSCPQINVYPYGALTLATAAVEQAISMWVESSHQTNESKSLAGVFSDKGQWGKSCASYALSITTLTSTAWGEIRGGALDFVKHGRCTAPSVVKSLLRLPTDGGLQWWIALQTKVIPGTSTHFPGQSMIPGPGMAHP
ncbi:hypothetical protein EDC04DRAFT_2613213 [Pisolithus marmoratus]|nr:hypothetical protein EDC04DRAFT_2613213 [Pisolithus marmoratus]